MTRSPANNHSSNTHTHTPNQIRLSPPQVPASRPLPASLQYIVMECWLCEF